MKTIPRIFLMGVLIAVVLLALASWLWPTVVSTKLIPILAVIALVASLAINFLLFRRSQKEEEDGAENEDESEEKSDGTRKAKSGNKNKGKKESHS